MKDSDREGADSVSRTDWQYDGPPYSEAYSRDMASLVFVHGCFKVMDSDLAGPLWIRINELPKARSRAWKDDEESRAFLRRLRDEAGWLHHAAVLLDRRTAEALGEKPGLRPMSKGRPGYDSLAGLYTLFTKEGWTRKAILAYAKTIGTAPQEMIGKQFYDFLRNRGAIKKKR